jgi:hypothetical protein
VAPGAANRIEQTRSLIGGASFLGETGEGGRPEGPAWRLSRLSVVEGWVPIVFLMFALKIPVGFLCYIVYWAIKAEVPLEEAPEESGEDHGFRRFRREPNRPRGPRRGPHAPDALPLPSGNHDGRTRTFTHPAPARAGVARARGTAEPARQD